MNHPIENYWRILQSTNEWIRFSDIKAGVILGIYGVLLTVISTDLKDIYETISKSYFQLFLIILLFSFIFLSGLFSFLCINPRLKNNNTNSIIYFGSIAIKFKNSTEYISNSSNVLANDIEIRTQLAEQIHTNSKIAWKKFSNVTWAIRFFILSILMIFILIISYIFS